MGERGIDRLIPSPVGGNAKSRLHPEYGPTKIEYDKIADRVTA